LGFPDEGNLPTSRTERRAYDLVAQGFGPGINGPLVIVANAGEAARVRSEVAADPGIAGVAPPETTGGVATLLAYPTTAPQDAATAATVARLRSTVEGNVGGNTADWIDIGDRLEDRLPSFVGAVVLLSFLLLTVMFRSVVVPLKAAILNLLSVGAAYGVLVVVFQWGWAAGLIGLESTVPIVPFIPVFMFALLFGLSMDYEVFLLSRIREDWVRRHDASEAVAQGIAHTGRVITAAATIMVCVFASFALGDDLVVKLFGIGLGVAVFLDAFVIRTALVPAIMELLGPRAWWWPRWLERVLPSSASRRKRVAA
ncbi:MAG: MMPL family transporter, partial [Solirubrobacteraceae bacterium]